MIFNIFKENQNWTSVGTCRKHLKVKKKKDSDIVYIGGLMQNKIIVKNFQGPFIQTSKISRPALWKLWINPIENHINSIFPGKIAVIIFKANVRRVKTFKGTLLASPPNKCMWTVPKLFLTQSGRELQLTVMAVYSTMIEIRSSKDSYLSVLVLSCILQKSHCMWAWTASGFISPPSSVHTRGCNGWK